MKKTLLMFFLILVAASLSFAQIIRITPKKTVYTRKGKVSFKEKRTFTITYPIISGNLPLATRKNLEKTISYWRVFDTSLKENLSGDDWLYEMSYAVNYNKNGILDISLTSDGSGAYPDQSTIELIVDLKTGSEIKFNDVFKTDSLPKFAELVDAKLKAETKKIIAEVDRGGFGENGKEADDSIKEQLGALSFTAESFGEYSVNDKGITIFYDAGFPHVIQAAEPDGSYFFIWAQIKPFIKPGGLLAKFIR